jgi:hypothetical protein
MWDYTVFTFSYRYVSLRSQVHCLRQEFEREEYFLMLVQTITHYAGSPKVGGKK